MRSSLLPGPIHIVAHNVATTRQPLLDAAMAAFAISTDLTSVDDDLRTRKVERQLCCGRCCPLLCGALALAGPALILVGWSAATPHFVGCAVGVLGLAVSAAAAAVSRRPDSSCSSRPAACGLQWGFGLVAFLVGLLVFIRSVSEPFGVLPPPGTFPADCYKSWYGIVPSACVRVAPGATAKQLAGLVPNASTPLFEMRLPASTIADAARDHLGGSFQTSVKSDESNVVHAAATTLIFGFTDDIFVAVDCAPSGLASVRAQSEQRLGSGDGGVNAARVRRLQAHLRSRAWPAETSC